MKDKILKFWDSSSRLYDHDIIQHQAFACAENLSSHFNYELCDYNFIISNNEVD